MKQTLKVFLVLGALVLGLSSIDEGKFPLSSTVMADTCMVGGVISTNTTWSTADCDTYVVYGNLLVDEGATLTVMPGVVVAFQQDYRLEIRGALTARGEVSDSIVFTGWESNQNPGWWDYIKFRNSSIDSACSLSYCRIEYAYYGVHCDTASPTISHSLIRKCLTGIYCYGGSPYILQNTLMENGYGQPSGGIYIESGSLHTFGNIIERNAYSGILVKPYGPSISVSITADTIRENYGYYGYGIRLAGGISATIRSCEIYQNAPDGGINAYLYGGGNVRITNCYIHDNTAGNGGGIRAVGGFALIDSNCISDNWATGSGNRAGGLSFYVDSARVQFNDIVGNSDLSEGVFEVYSGEPDSPDIHGEYNWWGTTNSDTISQLIYDYYDNFDLRKFIFTPFATEPYWPIWIKVTTPDSGEVLCSDSTYEITWDSQGDIDSVAIEYSTDGGSSWTPITESTLNVGAYPWTVPNTPSESCLVKISDAEDGDPVDTSDGYFTILSEPSIVVKSPNGGEAWQANTAQDIIWDRFCFSDSVIIEYTTDNGATWDTIVDTTTNDGVYSWTIPDTTSDSCLIRISHVVDNIPSDESDSLFSIVKYICGDANGDESIDLSDVIYLANYLLKGGDPPPDPICRANADGDDAIDLSDVIYIANYKLKGGPAPHDCGNYQP